MEIAIISGTFADFFFLNKTLMWARAACEKPRMFPLVDGIFVFFSPSYSLHPLISVFMTAL